MSNTSTLEKKKKFSAPHIYLLLIVVIVFCTLLTVQLMKPGPR